MFAYGMTMRQDFSSVAETHSGLLSRSRGAVRLSLGRTGESTVIRSLYEMGCLRARFPRAERGQMPEVVLMNTAGGLTGGDEIETAFCWQAGSSACISSSAAEKIYRASASIARVSNSLAVEENAVAEWLPQETIVFNGAALDRRLDVLLDATASFLAVDSVVLGRAAMGEEVTSAHLRDCCRIHRGGKLIYANRLDMNGDLAGQMDRNAIAAGARAFGTALFIAQNAADFLDPLRDVLAGSRGRAAASSWNGILAARFLARDGATLRHDMVRALHILRSGRPLPRVWQC